MERHTIKATILALKLKHFSFLLIWMGFISMIPLLVIAHANHPSADDFHYGLKTAQAWQSTGSISETLIAASATVNETYRYWQGNFSGIFLMSLQPSIFGEKWYAVGTYLVLLVYLIGLLLIVKALFDKFLPHSKGYYRIIGLTLFFFSIQLVPFPRQSYYWFNGSIYYTFFHGLALLLFALVLQLQKTERLSGTIPLFLFASILAVAIGGSNFVTSLQGALLLFFICVYLFATKGKNKLYISGVFVALLTAMVISIVAPGNAIRQAMVPNHPNVLMAVLESLFQAGLHIFKWTNLYLIGLFILLLPFVMDAVRTNSFSFKRPWLVPLGSFLLLAVSFTPPLYGLGSMPERALNIAYYLFILLAGINLFYLVGWLFHRQISIISTWKTPRFFIGVGCLILLAAFIQEPDIASKEATQSLLSGEANQYNKEANDRLRAYQDTNCLNLSVKEYTVKPTLLFVNDLGTSANDWQNEAAAKFYRKASIVLIKSSPEQE